MNQLPTQVGLDTSLTAFALPIINRNVGENSKDPSLTRDNIEITEKTEKIQRISHKGAVPDVGMPQLTLMVLVCLQIWFNCFHA